jgi:hypothetical protein
MRLVRHLWDTASFIPHRGKGCCDAVWAIEPFHTAMYDQAGAELLRLTPETVDRLTYFYQLVHTLQRELTRFRIIPLDQRQWHNATLRVRATQTALAMQETVRLPTAEGRVWPRPFPLFTIRGYPPVGVGAREHHTPYLRIAPISAHAS